MIHNYKIKMDGQLQCIYYIKKLIILNNGIIIHNLNIIIIFQKFANYQNKNKYHIKMNKLSNPTVNIIILKLIIIYILNLTLIPMKIQLRCI